MHSRKRERGVGVPCPTLVVVVVVSQFTAWEVGCPPLDAAGRRLGLIAFRQDPSEPSGSRPAPSAMHPQNSAPAPHVSSRLHNPHRPRPLVLRSSSTAGPLAPTMAAAQVSITTASMDTMTVSRRRGGAVVWGWASTEGRQRWFLRFDMYGLALLCLLSSPLPYIVYPSM